MITDIKNSTETWFQRSGINGMYMLQALVETMVNT